MLILAVETSCDDTAIAVLKIKENKKFPVFNALSNIISSQIETHKKYDGVYPAMAKREHQKDLVPVLMRALKQAKLLNPKSQIPITNQIPNSKFQILKNILNREEVLYKKLILFLKKYEKPEVDLIAITNGPGLEPCLWVGINFAKALSYYWNIPIVPVNHIEAHILVNFLNINKNFSNEYSGHKQHLFPAVCLVVSGGHTQIILMKKIGSYKILGETRDDAAGECLDKCAKILGLGYPGGPAIAKLAVEATNTKASVKLPRPMIGTKDYDFSFSGLKTAVLYHCRKQVWSNSHDRKKLTTLKLKQYRQKMAAEIQQAIIDVLLKKTIKSSKDFKAKTIILGGGVSANKELREQLKEKIQKEIPNTKCLIPDSELSTDNALMTATAGYFYKTKKIAWQKLKAEANLRIK
ncbi:MAG: hypothetical protein CEN87_381 [Parcubacteria group bacterium Licking1014_1]|nr:MAG: hypothetical protein CEN87_381 [Parcubacteria group bacterium Licking1014_1]